MFFSSVRLSMQVCISDVIDSMRLQCQPVIMCNKENHLLLSGSVLKHRLSVQGHLKISSSEPEWGCSLLCSEQNPVPLHEFCKQGKQLHSLTDGHIVLKLYSNFQFCFLWCCYSTLCSSLIIYSLLRGWWEIRTSTAWYCSVTFNKLRDQIWQIYSALK